MNPDIIQAIGSRCFTSHFLFLPVRQTAPSYDSLNMPGPQVLVIGASRGIGRELTTQLARDPATTVLASVRRPVDFGDLPNVRPITLDQSSSASVSAAAAHVPELDALILNGAIGDPEALLSTSEARLAEYFDVNVVGLLRVVQAFLPALRARKTRKIVLVSSTSGSLARQVNAKVGFSGPYAVSKAAANMLAVQLHNELHDSEGFTVVMVHPGWVKTDMGTKAGDGGITAAESAEGILRLVESLKQDDSAKFFDYKGDVLPW